MSRRVSRIHITVVARNTMSPTIEMNQLIVVPMTINVIPAAHATGRNVGPGR